MIQYLKLTGRLLAMGREQHHGAPLHASMVDYLKFETSDGKSRQVQEVVVPSLVHSTLAVGDAGEFDLIVMNYPKPFGTYSRYFLAGLRTGRGEVEATPEVRKWVAAQRAVQSNTFGSASSSCLALELASFFGFAHAVCSF